MKTIAYLLLILFGTTYIQAQNREPGTEDFSFAFMTDIHLQHGRNSVDGFIQAIDTLNKLNPDFLLTGGDLVEHGLMSQAGSAFMLYFETIKRINMPVYNTIGNHDCFSFSRHSKVENVKILDRKKLYKQYFGDTYYSFDYMGWHFMVLDAMSTIKDSLGNIIDVSRIDSLQIEWIKSELSAIDGLTPIVLSTHIPFLHSRISLIRGNYEPIGQTAIIDNSNEVLDLFKNHNLRLVLQGHMHILEDINANNKVRFITGGAVSADKWKGPKYSENPLFKMEEGFLILHIKNDEISWDYIDYGWEVTQE